MRSTRQLGSLPRDPIAILAAFRHALDAGTSPTKPAAG